MKKIFEQNGVFKKLWFDAGDPLKSRIAKIPDLPGRHQFIELMPSVR